MEKTSQYRNQQIMIVNNQGELIIPQKEIRIVRPRRKDFPAIGGIVYLVFVVLLFVLVKLAS